jgi:hypothetical protein
MSTAATLDCVRGDGHLHRDAGRYGARHAGGRAASAEENAAANALLECELRVSGRRFFPATRETPDGSWSEPGFAVVGMADVVAIMLARRFGQLAIFRVTAAGATVVDCR